MVLRDLVEQRVSAFAFGLDLREDLENGESTQVPQWSYWPHVRCLAAFMLS